MLTTFEKGMVKGQRETARLQLERRFGPLSETVLHRLEAWPAERLNDLLLAILDAPSLQVLGLAEDEKQPGNPRTRRSNRKQP